MILYFWRAVTESSFLIAQLALESDTLKELYPHYYTLQKLFFYGRLY